LSNLFILEPTLRTPEVKLDFNAGIFSISGECYPEDANKFFQPIHQIIEEYFSLEKDLQVFVNLIYFNSSSARALVELMNVLENYGKDHRSIQVTWQCDQADDVTQEFVEDLLMDYSFITVSLDFIES
jgi:hypothetical protein